MKVAVIGAGIAGISCASQLQQAGYQVVLFDKARSVGGRMTSKRSAQGYMDFGAQYFTARHPLFQQQVASWQQHGVVSRWLAPLYQYEQARLLASPDAQQRYVGIPAMHSPLKWQARQLDCQLSCRIMALKAKENTWQLIAESGEQFGPFDEVVLTLPPAQVNSLLPQTVTQRFPETILQPCWAVTLVLAKGTAHAAGGIFIKDAESPLSWVSRHNSKPGRAQTESWLLHFKPAFSALHLQQDQAFWQQTAEQTLSALLGQPLAVAEMISHRWLYAQIQTQHQDFHYEGVIAAGLWVAGDWTRGGRVENAWLSGNDIAQQIIVKQGASVCPSIG